MRRVPRQVPPHYQPESTARRLSRSMFFIDNPSYFSMGNGESASSASECSLTRQATPPRSRNPPRDKKSYLRSVSTNSADSNQELLIMGEPRLSDIAPDLAFKHPASRSNSLKGNRADMAGDLSYIPLATSEEQADSLSGDEVFIAEESARSVSEGAVELCRSV